MPGPREISPNCGVAICFDYNKAEEIKELFKKEKILYENIYYYPEAKKISKWF
ncbi:MAG: putative Se/S carrier-like protein [Candidatus Humimicrobiaceae bacterium]